MTPPDWITRTTIKKEEVVVNGKKVESEVEKKWREIWEEECKTQNLIYGSERETPAKGREREKGS